MKPLKKPPPDNEGNVVGRIRALKTLARERAKMDEGEHERALGRRLKELEPQLHKLRARLAKVRKSAPAPKGDLLATLGGL